MLCLAQTICGDRPRGTGRLLALCNRMASYSPPSASSRMNGWTEILPVKGLYLSPVIVCWYETK
jgi:hypothetical protein